MHGGTGGVGLAAIQLGAMHGMEVFATAGSEDGVALVKANGARHGFIHRQERYMDQVS